MFVLLARTAPSFRSKTALPGWLFRTARFTAQNARTREQRRRQYEEKAALEIHSSPDAGNEHWSEIEPLLNQSLAALREEDRNCVLLRFFQDLSFAEVGASLGLSEEAARKRVTRSLDKMRGFFTKEGVVVPSAVLAVLLSAHAAKAAPPACGTDIATLAAGLSAGITTATVTGSHVYQLSEGALQAMKLAQLKVAAGVAAAITLGLTTYAVARGISPSTARAAHLYQEAPGQTLTGLEVAERCRAAYMALQTYQVTSTVTVHSVETSTNKVEDGHSSAVIQFSRSGKLHVEGVDTSAKSFAYISDGTATVETASPKQGPWQKVLVSDNSSGAGMAIARVTGTAMSAATTVPSLLLGTDPGAPSTSFGVPPPFGKDFLALMSGPSNPIGRSSRLELKDGTIKGNPCYILVPHISIIPFNLAYWIDKKTFLLRRVVTDIDSRTMIIPGVPQAKPSENIHAEENFTAEHVNESIPDSTFTLPAAQ